MEQIIDITLPLTERIPIWPGSEGLRVSSAMSLENEDPANVTVMCCDVHTGTHIDTPRHFIPSGKSTEDFTLDTFIGPTYVADMTGLSRITVPDLERTDIPPDTNRILLRTDNSVRLKRSTFNSDYTYITPEAASWIADRGCRLLGFDYLSIEQFDAAPLAHLALLSANVVILEGIDLYRVERGWYELICLPIRLTDSEGALVRAVLFPQARRP